MRYCARAWMLGKQMLHRRLPPCHLPLRPLPQVRYHGHGGPSHLNNLSALGGLCSSVAVPYSLSSSLCRPPLDNLSAPRLPI